MSGQTSGSCEACKRKKCKCDRKLPCCAQCLGTALPCNYAENNKRGIPGGYLGLLEQRLAETENALHNAISELRSLKSGGIISLQMPGQEKNTLQPITTSKTSRMEEWRKYPLETTHDLEQWWYGIGKERTFSDSQPPNSHYRGEDMNHQTTIPTVHEQSPQPVQYAFNSPTDNPSQGALFLPPNPQSNSEQARSPTEATETQDRMTFQVAGAHETANCVLGSNVRRVGFGQGSGSQSSIRDNLEERPESSTARRVPQLAQAQSLTRSMNHLYY